MIKISVCCCTYNRPHLLGELIESYQRQSYPVEYREMIILDDAGQYGNIQGEGWQIVSFPRRFASLGEKRNACVSLTSHDSEYFVVADDDDIYLPWWLESHARNFQRGARWSFASSIFWSERNRIVSRWHYRDQVWIMHPAHAFRKETFWKVGGYPHIAWREDEFLFERLRDAGVKPQDALDAGGNSRTPYLIFRRNPSTRHHHVTGMSLEKYRNGYHSSRSMESFEIGWKKDYLAEANEFMKRNNG